MKKTKQKPLLKYKYAINLTIFSDDPHPKVKIASSKDRIIYGIGSCLYALRGRTKKIALIQTAMRHLFDTVQVVDERERAPMRFVFNLEREIKKLENLSLLPKNERGKNAP